LRGSYGEIDLAAAQTSMLQQRDRDSLDPAPSHRDKVVDLGPKPRA